MNVITWLLTSDEPWTCYRVLTDLLERPMDDPEVILAYQEMTAHDKVREIISSAEKWEEVVLKRHNDSGHPLHAISTLVDFGLRIEDDGMGRVVDKLFRHVSAEGSFQTLVFIPAAFGGPNNEMWSWLACDAPVLLYNLVQLGYKNDPAVQNAIRHLTGLVAENGFGCAAAPELGRFRGPGKKGDPCPIATVYALKVFSLLPEMHDSTAVTRSIEMLLSHWDSQVGTKYYLFGVGKKFRKLKYPFVWYDLLHVADVLSRFESARTDDRFLEMINAIQTQADANGQYTPSSMYMAWKGWSFSNKKEPSPWLTYLVLRIFKRLKWVTPEMLSR